MQEVAKPVGEEIKSMFVLAPHAVRDPASVSVRVLQETRAMFTAQFSFKSLARVRAFLLRIFYQKNAAPSYWPHVGDRVVIFYLGLGGPLIEGWADIVAYGPVPHQFYVRFLGETETRRRFVNPEWQRLPDCSLALLKAFWRSQRGDDLFFDASANDDLFVDDPRFEDEFLDTRF